MSLNMQVDKRALDFIKEVEGSENNVYEDSAGYDTIGVGHLITRKEKERGYIKISTPGKERAITFADGITDQEIEDILESDLQGVVKSVNSQVKVPLEQNKFNALVSFVFNIGASNFASSTLLKLLNEGRYSQVPEQFHRWNKAGGVVVKGLVNRRKKETELWYE